MCVCYLATTELPGSADMFGDFSRDHYFPGFGTPIEKEMMVYPWIKAAHCPEAEDDMVCARDDLIFTKVTCADTAVECKLF